MASYLDTKKIILDRISRASDPNEKKELYVKLYRLNEAYNLFDKALEKFGKEVEPDNWADAQANKGSDMSGNEDDGDGVDNAYGGDSPSGEGGDAQSFDEESEDFAIYIPDDVKKQAQAGFVYKNPDGVSYEKQRNGRWKKVADEKIAKKKPTKLKKGTQTETLGINDFVKIEKPTKSLVNKLEKRGKDRAFRSWNTTTGHLFYYDPKSDSWYKSAKTFSQKSDAIKAFQAIQALPKPENQPKDKAGIYKPIPLPEALKQQPIKEKTPAPVKEEQEEPKAPAEEKITPPASTKKTKTQATPAKKSIVLPKHDVNFIKYGMMKLSDGPEDVQDWFTKHDALGASLFVDKEGNFWNYQFGVLKRSDIPLDEKKIKAYHQLQDIMASFAKSDRYQKMIDGYQSEDIDKTLSLMTDEEAGAINYLCNEDSFKYGLKSQGRKIAKSYTSTGYIALNSFLRKRLDKIYIPSSDKKSFNIFLVRQAAKAKLFNSYLDSQPKDTSKLYRGKSLDEKSFQLAQQMFKVGEVMFDPGFSSASRNKGVAKGFSSKKTHRLLIEFDGDHGGVDLKKLSSYSSEDETLIPQGAKYEIYDVSVVDNQMKVKVRKATGDKEATKVPFSEEV